MWGKSKLFFLFIIILCLGLDANAQKTLHVHGIVKDVKTREPIPFANVYIKGQTIGVTCDFEGRFDFYFPNDKKGIIGFSFIGYYDYTAPIKNIKPKRKMRIWLTPEVTQLEEVTVLPTENPAHSILRNIVKNRRRNNPDKNTDIEYDKYSKNLILFRDLDKKFANKNIFRNYKNLFIKQDNGNLSIPVYFSEKLTSNIKQKKPYLERSQTLTENIKNIAFLDIDDIKGYREELTSQTNIYNNQLNIYSRTFISPIASTGLLYYKYYLKDSIQTISGMEYKIIFKPKNKKNLLFKGFFIVDKKTWALKEITAEISASANINFLNSLNLYYAYSPIDSTSSYYKQRNIKAEFSYNKIKDTSKIASTVLMQENTSYSQVTRLEKRIEPALFNWETYNKTKDFSTIKPVKISELSKLERKSSSVIDSLNNTWMIKAGDKIFNTILSGYIDVGKFGFGPYLEMIKRNKLEGIRLNLGVRTNEHFSENYMFYGSLGYGLKDKKFKYSGSALYKFKSEKRKTFTITLKEDIIRLSENGSIFKIKENMLSSAKDNIIAALAKRNSNESLFREKSLTVKYSNEWNKNFTTNISLQHRQLYSTKFGSLAKDNIKSSLLINEVKIDNRISFHEKLMDKYIRRYYLGSAYPIIHLGCDLGTYNFNKSNGKYIRCTSTIKQYLNIGLSQLRYIAEIGHTFGVVPFPLLEVHRSNQTRGFARFSFNLMENCEYINSSHISIMPELHLNGLIFNKIPLINKLNLREVFTAKAAWGYLDKKHRELMDLPEGTAGLSRPYCELGVGIENIFKYIRIDAVWRLTDKNKVNIKKFGIFAALSISL